MWYYVRYSAKKTYAACNLAGEKIAWLFGITKPKYHAELQHYDRMNEEVCVLMIANSQQCLSSHRS
jgi:hypothetical protein